MEAKALAFYICITIFITTILIVVYYEEKYDLGSLNKFCKSAGQESFRGISYNILEEENKTSISVNAVLCKGKEGTFAIKKYSRVKE